MNTKEGIIDIHCHILPNLDDGPSSIEESLAMLEEAVKAGVSEIVATPHLIWQERLLSEEEIQSAIEHLPSAIRIHRGAEVPLMEVPSLLENGKIITTGKLVLLDTPPLGKLIGLEQAIFKIVLKRLTPVIAHPERNIPLAMDKRRLEHLKNMGALFQVNAGSLFGIFGRDVKKAAENLIQWGLADIIASDAHSPEAFVHLQEAVKLIRKRWGEEFTEKLTRQNVLPLIRKEAQKVEPGV